MIAVDGHRISFAQKHLHSCPSMQRGKGSGFTESKCFPTASSHLSHERDWAIAREQDPSSCSIAAWWMGLLSTGEQTQRAMTGMGDTSLVV